MRWVWLPLALVGIFMIAYGVHLDRHEAVEQYAKKLCTACIGLE